MQQASGSDVRNLSVSVEGFNNYLKSHIIDTLVKRADFESS